MKIENLKTNRIREPLGFAMDAPSFSWTVTDTTAKRQQAARVLVSRSADFSQPLYDSGKSAEISSLGFAPEFTLLPRTRYYWQVTIFAENGETASADSWFETGKREEPWQGGWIAAPFEKDIHPYLVRPFRLEKALRSARLYITGLGLYEAYLNGRRAGNEYFAPGCNNYNHWLQYQTYDVTALLQLGENRLGVMLGKGWYQGRFRFDDRGTFGEGMRLQAELRLEFADGTEETVASDREWLCSPSPVTDSSIYDGEWYDARLEKTDWNTKSGSLAGWVPVSEAPAPTAAPGDRWSLPVTIMQWWTQATLLRTPAGEDVIDFGQEMTGWVEFDCDLPAGATVQLQYGELLQHGNFYNDNLRSAKAQYTYISAGRPAHVRPHFTFYGFRYVKVTGMEKVDLSAFTACVLYSNMDAAGRLETSDARVNRLVQNALWGQRGNFLDVPTDCPQRDERLGWTGDAEIFCAAASYNMDTAAFYAKYLHDMLLEQRTLDGSVPSVVPDVLTLELRGKGQPGDAHGASVWGDAATVIPWTDYLFFGDRRQLAREYENMKLWVGYIKKQDDTQCGGSRLWQCGFHFGDWLAMDNPDKTSCFGATDPYFIASAYYFYSASLTAKAAKALGKTEEAAYYADLAAQVKAAIQKEYFTATGRLAVPTQTALALALHLELAPEFARKRLIADLAARLDANKGYLDTGFVGTYHLCYALAENGLAERAYTLLLNTELPSWLYEVGMGATTIWERWNSVLPDGLVSDTGMNSLNHYSYGAVVEWMYREMCGIAPCEDAPGFKKAVIHPRPDARFSFANAEYRSAAGLYRAGWKRGEGRTTYELEIPFDAQAEFVLEERGRAVQVNGCTSDELQREGRLALSAGRYTVTVEL